MPPARRPTDRGAPATIVAAAVAVAVAAGMVWLVVRFASQNPDKANLGDPVFQVGRASRLAEEVDDRGPFLFQDPLSAGRGRNLYIQHLGDDPDEGWSAIEARLPDDPACAVEWDRARGEFVDCRDGRHPADGGGLTTYRGTVDDGQVSVDLRTGSGAAR
jgi:hypothetical protein